LEWELHCRQHRATFSDDEFPEGWPYGDEVPTLAEVEAYGAGIKALDALGQLLPAGSSDISVETLARSMNGPGLTFVATTGAILTVRHDPHTSPDLVVHHILGPPLKRDPVEADASFALSYSPFGPTPGHTDCFFDEQLRLISAYPVGADSVAPTGKAIDLLGLVTKLIDGSRDCFREAHARATSRCRLSAQAAGCAFLFLIWNKAFLYGDFDAVINDMSTRFHTTSQRWLAHDPSPNPHGGVGLGVKTACLLLGQHCARKACREKGSPPNFCTACEHSKANVALLMTRSGSGAGASHAPPADWTRKRQDAFAAWKLTPAGVTALAAGGGTSGGRRGDAGFRAFTKALPQWASFSHGGGAPAAKTGSGAVLSYSAADVFRALEGQQDKIAVASVEPGLKRQQSIH
jgi:hypothetical protein